jgi:hypothetical protein
VSRAPFPRLCGTADRPTDRRSTQGPRLDYIDYDTRDHTFGAYVQRAYQIKGLSVGSA